MFTVVFACSKETREKIIGKKLYIGHSRTTLNDYTEPTKCYKCNKYGHTSKNCLTKEEDIWCGKCGKLGLIRQTSLTVQAAMIGQNGTNGRTKNTLSTGLIRDCV
jgi:hypothetical protein